MAMKHTETHRQTEQYNRTIQNKNLIYENVKSMPYRSLKMSVCLQTE